MKVLIADDDQDDIDLFQEALYDVNPQAELTVAADGRDVLDKLKVSKPHVIFLDINMPRMNGWECLAVMKNDRMLKDIPVIMFTTSSSLRDVENARKTGALGLLTKPDRYESLKTFLAQMDHAMRLGKLDDFGRELKPR